MAAYYAILLKYRISLCFGGFLRCDWCNELCSVHAVG